MSVLADQAADYLKVRRALGYKLERAEKLLGQFVVYCDAHQATTVSVELAVAWAQSPVQGSAWWWSQRLSVVRAFARWLQTREPATEVPPAGIFGPARGPRAVPFLYSDAEIVALMDATETLRHPLARATYRCLIGLLAVTGMRLGEALRLDLGHLDWEAGEVIIEHSKFDHSRRVALHPSTLDALRAYGAERDRLCPAPATTALLVSSAGTRLLAWNVGSHFRHLVARCGLTPRGAARPRLHDLRHRYAVLTVLEWHQAGVDVDAFMPRLSTVLGHTNPVQTFWYLTGSPELFTLAADRLERYQQERQR